MALHRFTFCFSFFLGSLFTAVLWSVCAWEGSYAQKYCLISILDDASLGSVVGIFRMIFIVLMINTMLLLILMLIVMTWHWYLYQYPAISNLSAVASNASFKDGAHDERLSWSVALESRVV